MFKKIYIDFKYDKSSSLVQAENYRGGYIHFCVS